MKNQNKKMMKKLENGKRAGALFWEGLLIGILLISIISFAFLVIAQEVLSPQDELAQLESEISGSGYDWLVNYSVVYPSVDVFRENSNDLLATFFNVSGGVNNSFKKYQIFLTGLGENESLSTFDLRSVGVGGDVGGIGNSGMGSGVSYDYVVDPTPSGLFNWSIPYGYNLLNDSLGLGTLEGISDTGTRDGYSVYNIGNNVYVGSQGAGWAADSAGQENITINFTKPYNFDLVEFFPFLGVYTWTANLTRIWVSEDGTIWNNITGWIQLWGGVTPTQMSPYYISFDEQTKQYIRIELDGTIGGGDAVSLGEVGIYKNSTNLGNSSDTIVTTTSAGGISALTNMVWAAGGYFIAGSANANNTNITYNFSSSKSVNNFHIGWRNGGPYSAGNMSVYVSNDGSTWTNVQDYSNIRSYANEIQIIYFPIQRVQYLKINLRDSYNPANGFIIDEIRIFEQPDTSSNNTINIWNCSTSQLWSNSSCWSLGRLPQMYDNVVFNSTGTGECNITNNTMPQGLSSFVVEETYNATTSKIRFAPLFAQGNWSTYSGTQEWNVWGDINISNGTMYVYGDAFNSSTLSWMVAGGLEGMHNITEDGRGQVWKSVSGNINVGSGAVIDGVGLGFPALIGPGYSNHGGCHGGFSCDSTSLALIYGNASAPTSLGSGSSNAGGSGIKLDASSGNVNINGNINTSGNIGGWNGAGGSIWLRGSNISGTGIIRADGGTGSTCGAGGGRIRFDFNSYSYSGIISTSGGGGTNANYGPGKVGTFSWGNLQGGDNYTWPGNGWTVNGSIGLVGGNYTVLGNLVVPSGYDLGVYALNNTASDNGTGVVINATGNITINGRITGFYGGFSSNKGPGKGLGPSYGGVGGDTRVIYGSETQPTSLGSASDGAWGGGAVRLISNNGIINISGAVRMDSNDFESTFARPGTGGSIWLDADTITGGGNLSTRGFGGGSRTSGGGRIALTGNIISFSGLIVNTGGSYTGLISGSGGTVYINATTSITSSMNISVVGYNGTTGATDWGQRINLTAPLLTLSGVYNASRINSSVAGTVDGKINTIYTDCSSSFDGAVFNPDPNYVTACGLTVTAMSPANNSNFNSSSVDFNVSLNRIGSWCGFSLDGGANATMTKFNNTYFNYTNSSMVEGVHNVLFSCNDTGNNYGYSSLSRFLVDTSVPILTVSDPLNNSYWSNASVLFNVSSSETTSGNGTIVPNLDSSLVSWWRMDDLNASGGVVDYLGRNNGTRVNATSTTAGRFGKAMSFDGVNDYVSVPFAQSLNMTNQNLTASFWVNGILSGGGLIARGSLQVDSTAVYGCRISAAGSIQCMIGNGTTRITAKKEGLSNNVWYHIAFIWNGTGVSIYSNGVFVQSGAGSGTTKDTTNALQIGLQSSFYFNGTIDDVMIFNRSLTSDEIKALYNATQINHNANPVLADGSHSFNAYAQDFGGNVNASETNVFVVDTTTPSVALNAPSDAQWFSYKSVIFNYTATGTNLQTCVLYANFSGAWAANATNSSLTTGVDVIENITIADGYYVWNAHCNNTAGTTGTGTNRTVGIDSVYPDISIVYPSAGVNSSVSGLDVNFTVSDLNLQACWYSNDSFAGNLSLTCGANITSVTWTDGQHNVTVWANDSAGNLNSSSITFIIDTANPAINFTSPTPQNDSYQNTGSLFVNVSVSDAFFRNLTFWLYNDTDTLTLVNETTYTSVSGGASNVNWSLDYDDIYYYNVSVIDYTGNTNVTETRKFTRDNTYPLISYGTGTENDLANFSRANVYVNVSFTEINFANVTFSLYNGTSTVNSTTFATATYNINWTGLADNNYTYQVNITDKANNKNYTIIRRINLDDTPPNITIVYPDNLTNHYVNVIDFNASATDIGSWATGIVESCLYSLDGDANVSMTKLNATWFNYTYSGIAHGYHNLTVSCNDTLGNMRSVSETDWNVNLLDLSIPSVSLPSPLHPNATLIVINVSNNGPPTASNINVSCYLDGVIFDSKMIDTITGPSSYLTNCSYTFYSGNYSLNVTVDIPSTIPESNENNNENITTANVVIELRNESSVGVVTGLSTINNNESVNINITIPAGTINTGKVGYNLSSVWVGIAKPDGTFVNLSLSGSRTGGMWNATYTNPGILGTYLLTYYANLTNKFNQVETSTGNFSIQNTSITINVPGNVNTTDIVPISGIIYLWNGSTLEALASNVFNIKINNTLVSSDTYGSNDFSGGAGWNVNMSDSVRLNLTEFGGLMSYSDDYSTTKYLTDANSYDTIGYSESGYIFEMDAMPKSIGNVTYRYSVPTSFVNATVWLTTLAASEGTTGNTSIWYGFDNSTWTILNSSTAKGVTLSAEIPVNLRREFYVMLLSNTNGFAGENPVTWYQANYTMYEYPSSGHFNSSSIYLPNVSYTVLRWDENLSGQAIKIQLRESDDGSNWGAWSSNYTNYADNSITSYTKDYIQWRAILETTNANVTPILHSMNISFFNASTNATGGYSYNITIPTDTLGAVPLEVSVVESSSGVVGFNSTDIVVWARTNTPYAVARNYTQANANYSVWVNFTRSDTNALINGTIVVNVSNATTSSTQSCSGVSSCVVSWKTPANLGYGNYSVNISAYNESGYYRNVTTGYSDYLEARNTSAGFKIENKTIGDLQAGTDYSFLANVTIDNIGGAAIRSPYIWQPTKHTNIKTVTQMTPCTTIWPGQSCNSTYNITVDGDAPAGTYSITWRMNWTDNDGNLAGGETSLLNYSYVSIELNATMSISNSSVNLAMEHETATNFTFDINSIGTASVVSINVSFSPETLPASWIAFYYAGSPGLISGISPTYSETVTVNVTVPAQTASGNYSGIINATSGNAGVQYLNLTVDVPANRSWYVTPSENLTYNRSVSLSTAGEVGNWTVVNIGNVNLSFAISYAPGRTLNYDDYPGLFTSTSQPSQLNISKGTNQTFAVSHNGYNDALADVGFVVSISNSSASPTQYVFEDAITIEEQAPEVTHIWFLLDGKTGNTSEVNKNLTIKIRATDDLRLNETATRVNVTIGGTTYVLNATALTTFGEFTGGEGNRIVLNYTANFTPTSSGLHNATAIAYDLAGASDVSSVYNFTAYATSTVGIKQNTSAVTTADIDKTHQFRFYVNYTLNNTGVVYAYAPNISFVKNESILITPASQSFSDMATGANASKVFEVNVSALTPPGTYSVTATVKHMNPDYTNTSATVILNITVSSNKSMAFSPSVLNVSVPSGTSNSTTLAINNSGNDLLQSMSLSCLSGALCGNFTVGFNESSFSIARNTSINVNVTLTAAAGLTAGVYDGVVRVTEQSITKDVDISATVPETWTWTATPLSVNSSKAASQSGELQGIIITHTGNIDILFNLSSTNSSIAVPNVSSILAAAGVNTTFMINYSSPNADGSYLVTVSITNASAVPPQLNVSVNLTVTNLNITIVSPTSSNKLTNVTAGKAIEVLANATFNHLPVTSGCNYTLTIGDSSCTNVISAYDASNVWWNISCIAPSVTGGVTHNLSVSLSHTTYGDVTGTSLNSVTYRDITPPVFNAITRNNVNAGSAINLSANITDNVMMDSVIVSITYPNGSIANGTMTNLTNLLYNFSSIILNDYGEYVVNYTANDTTGNVNSTIDWFEVEDKYNWIFTLKDYNSAVVSGINISLLRPNTATILLNNITTATGAATFNANRRFYDLKAVLSGDEVIARNVNFTNISTITFNLHRIEVDDLAEIISLHKTFDGIASNSTGFSNTNVSLIFNYSGLNYDNANELEIVKCANWAYSTRSCNGTWTVLDSSRDVTSKKIYANSSGFSAYFLTEDKCGNGLCEATYAETTSTCSADCVTAQGSTTVSVTGGGGGGGGGVSSRDLAKIEELIRSFINIGGVKLETTSIYKELFAGDTTTFRIKLINTLNRENEIKLRAEGDVAQFITFESTSVTLLPNENRDVLIRVTVPKFTEPGDYAGDLILSSGEEEGKLPVTIKVLSPEGKLLDVKIQPLQEIVAPGEVLMVQVDLLNLGRTNKVDVQFDMQLIDRETGEIFARTEEALAIETSISEIKDFKIPENTPLGKYLLKGIARYSSLEEANQEATSIASVEVGYDYFLSPIIENKWFSIPIWIYLAVVLIMGMAAAGYFVKRRFDFRKRRFQIKTEFSKLPHPGLSSGFVGKIAETDVRAFVELNKLQMHTLVAGSTGSGKTVAAQDIVEAALLHNKSVIVFDPTAQWTGFLRKSEDSGMMRRYKYFDMKTKEARGFNGIIKTIRDPYEIIDIKKYIERPGEITIFNVSNLSPKEIDIVVASTIEQVFKSEPTESSTLKTLIVYDEVHRLLPKFGGAGKGFIQIERGAREFRKWGIGLVLISQVLSDFVGEVKANIGTEVQMGTRYEGDLERVSVKYGEDVLKAVAKEPIGSGMVVNPEYNSGRPYFVAFRPLLHSTKRLSKGELSEYEKYFDELEDLQFQISEFEKAGVDILDFNLELKLASSKIKEGQFKIAEMYLETLRPKVEEQWRNLGKKPAHLVRMKLSKEEVEKGIETAEKERAKYIKKNPEKEVSLQDDISTLKKKIEQKKKEGKKTTEIEGKLEDLMNRLKPFKGKMNEKDAEGIMLEITALKKEVEKI